MMSGRADSTWCPSYPPAKDYVGALARLYRDSRGRALSEISIDLAGTLLRSLGRVRSLTLLNIFLVEKQLICEWRCGFQITYEERQPVLAAATLYAPSESGVMYRIEELVYSDAQWLLSTIQVRIHCAGCKIVILNQTARLTLIS